MRTLDTKTIIANMLKEDHKTYISISKLQELLMFIYTELEKQEILNNYEIYFDVNFDSIERTVIYNSHIFILDIFGETIYLKETQSADELVDKFGRYDEIVEIINKFLSQKTA